MFRWVVSPYFLYLHFYNTPFSLHLMPILVLVSIVLNATLGIIQQDTAYSFLSLDVL